MIIRRTFCGAAEARRGLPRWLAMGGVCAAAGAGSIPLGARNAERLGPMPMPTAPIARVTVLRMVVASWSIFYLKDDVIRVVIIGLPRRRKYFLA
jgi:hypothetical protein